MRQNPRRILTLLVSLLVLLVALNTYVNLQRVSFIDRALEEAVREKLKRSTGTLYRHHVQSIEELDATGRGIERLEGIESLKNLKRLQLEDNQVADVTPLEQLCGLTSLSLRNNGITALETIHFEALHSLPLERLSLRHNVMRRADGQELRLADIGLLRQFSGLKELELRDNHIEDISPLGGLTTLVELDVSQNPIQKGNIASLKNLTNLQVLNLRETGLTDISALSRLTNLTYLNLHSNPDIDTIAPVQQLTQLETLILRHVPLAEQVEYLTSLTRLKRLNLRDCQVTELSALGELMAQGALQDHPPSGTIARVDLRDNPVPTQEDEGVDGYGPIRPYWPHITGRHPTSLP